MTPTKDALRRIYRSVAETACRIINHDHEEVAPQILLYDADAHWLTAMPPPMVRNFHTSSTGKDVMMIAIDAMLTGQLPPGIPTPDVVVHMCEAWHRAYTQDEESLMAMHSMVGLSLEHVPNRGECVAIALHTLERTHFSMMPIEGSGRLRRCEYKDFDSLSDGELRGRLMRGKQGG